MSFFTGSPAEYEQVSNLTPSQLKLQKERERASRGAFNQARNYYSGLLSDNSADMQAFAAPELRRFNEQTVPGLAEQFAGMGAGGLSSSGFRNAAVGAGTDLSERLASMRANLRQNAAAGLQGLAGGALTPHSQYQMTNPGSEGFLSNVASGIGGAIPGFLMGGPAGAAAGFAGGLFGGGGGGGGSGAFGQSSPYGKQGGGGYQGSFGQLPNFCQR
jgi:hypothetical protein